MQTIYFNDLTRIDDPISLTIGTFDGLHLGHIKVLESLKISARNIGLKTMMVSFWPHPRVIVDGKESAPLLLNTLEEKISILEKLQIIDILVILPFDEVFASMNYFSFLKEILVEKLNVKQILIGYDHKFGKGREGDFQKLEFHSKEFGYELIRIDEHQLDKAKISSTEIRNLLNNGEVKGANQLLGYSYQFEGKVVKGNQLGRTIGFPTANLALVSEEKLIPGNGVYAVFVQINENSYKGMMNIGYRPTVNGHHKTMEVNIFDFNQDIYGKNIVVIFLEKLRNERNFGGLDALVSQLEIDKLESIQLFTKVKTR